ncbi:MAG: 16S rRNA (guanine(527)-N(7))-methyltransferase RsmG [Rhodospirillales bacterium]|jgi:16S rRNA (guanine527-N7)-methyltransferase|nr:16S rRNA (guanine(527)-N(7))-methyltransferase RsmG [Rhodospirillales bacterium]MBT4006275.1 16S rRNA (guanine(527)-N(7))-methyltransferase RsmG [Rhodospirillales bacterium]MBT5075663.1 16S rRNA (guanine(527)-N(7))-methyltransferase RsmG [Rhodospirillales bacterium]MBT5112351.1 16S rRNA (guanine(527)-N(7))-methyltransferase RsmG [Rhodospirillales bacterium]MBT5672052.1 16S rRNA (guanine(527)-N(7))-methyltransferase RsmG [Rhodospirillales bacterium]
MANNPIDTPYGENDFSRDVNVSRETLDALIRYHDHVVKWQKVVNLVGPESLGYIWHRHILDSAQLLPLLPKKDKPVILLDLGSGGGFPGLVLAILAAGQGLDLAVHLVESNGRKCSFLRETARVCGVNVEIHRQRLEQISPFEVDVITARGFAPLPKLLDLAEPFLTLSDPLALLLKGRTCDQELTAARKNWKIEADTIPSESDPEGVVLRIKGIKRG